MNKRLKYFLLCCVMLLSGCQNSGQHDTSAAVGSSISSAETDNPSSSVMLPETADQVAEQTSEADLAVVEELLNSTDIQKIYYGPAGTLLVHTSDTLYWYDMNNACALAQRPADDWLDVEYYPIEDGFYAVGTLASTEGAEGFSSVTSSTICIFYDRTLQETGRFILNDLGDGVDYVRCAAVSHDGKTIAYCTMDKLYCYDCAADTVRLVLDLNHEQIEANQGLSSISTLVFSPDGDKILFVGSTFSLPVTTGQYSFLTYGCISLDGSNLQNLSFRNFEAGSMAGAAGGYLFFEESMTSALGKVAVVNSSDMEQQVYSLGTASEGESGLFCSQNGDYYATVKLEDDQWFIRIYSQETGKLVTTHVVEETNEEYYYRTPAIYTLDDLGLCIVKLGGFSDIPSKIVAFFL